jgi:hypothetical protein
MREDRLVAGLDIGSAKTTAIIAEVVGDFPKHPSIKILGVGQARIQRIALFVGAGKLRFELRVDGGGEGLGEADERGQRLRVVLRLRQQVLGHRRRVGVVVGDH